MRGASGCFRGVKAGPGFRAYPVSPLPSRVSSAVCGGPSGCPLSLLAGTPFHAVCASMRARSSCPSGIRRVSFVSQCARALAASAPLPPPLVGVVRSSRAVPVVGACRALPRGSCPSACPASVPCPVWLAWAGGWPGPLPPSPCLGLWAPFWADPRAQGVPTPGGALGGGGGGCVPSIPEVRPGGPEGRGVALPSLCLP